MPTPLSAKPRGRSAFAETALPTPTETAYLADNLDAVAGTIVGGLLHDIADTSG